MIWLLPLEDDNNVRHTHGVLYLLLGMNAIVFAWMLGLPAEEAGALVDRYALRPADRDAAQWLTSTFLHADWLHLLGNLFFLWLLGDNLEDAFGHLGFLLLYVIGGLAGAAAFVVGNPDMLTPTVGASGCIAAVAGAYTVLFGGRRVTLRLMVLVLPVWRFQSRAIWVMLLWFGFDLARTIYLRGELEDGGGVNFVVHGGGFAFGLLAGLVARMHGVMRRYETLPRGGFLFGYWPESLEREHRKERAIASARAQREALAVRERGRHRR